MRPYNSHFLRERFPSDFFQQHRDLEELNIDIDIDDDKLTELPPEIGQLHNLITLYLGVNKLTTLPPEIGQLQTLEQLDLGENQLTTLPPEIRQLQNLQQLDLGKNQLTTLTPEIGQLQNLITLYLGENQLNTLPPEIRQLQNLQQLDLGKNQLNTLPPEIRQLQNLQQLDLGENQLNTLPLEIGQLQNLQQLDLGDNPIEDLSALANHPNQNLQVSVSAFRVDLRRQYWTHLSQWKSEWLLTEGNAGMSIVLFKVLRQQIGYERICEELPTIELDHWCGYTLLKIKVHEDIEPILNPFLKMLCPSTNHINFNMVPLEITSAEEAVNFLNHNIEQDSFEVQT